MKSIKLFILLVFTITGKVSSQELLNGNSLVEDFYILKNALEELHPGLYKYTSSNEINDAFAELKHKLSKDQTLQDAYRHISLFTAKIQCGHTYCNFWNQSDSLRKNFIYSRNKVPFTFRIINEEAYIFQNLSHQETVKSGDHIISINGMPMNQILSELKKFVKADGANDAKRLFDLQLFGVDNYEPFDIYFPLVMGLDSGINIQLVEYDNNQVKNLKLGLITRKERYGILTERYGKQIQTYDDYWNFDIIDDNVAYLQLGTFVTWKMKLNWRKYLDNAFNTIRGKAIENLIIDIRGNEGGNTDVQDYLYKQLRKKPAVSGPFQQTLKTNYVSEKIRPYIDTWSNNNYDLRKKTVRLENGFYTFKKDGLIANEDKANNYAYKGNVYLLADASNSSGTFFLINYLKKNELATVIGQASGGNQQGITGGQIFMLHLPYSKLEVDIPVIGYYPPTLKPNKGINPDVEVELTVEDLIDGNDAVLKKVLEIIKDK